MYLFFKSEPHLQLAFNHIPKNIRLKSNCIFELLHKSCTIIVARVALDSQALANRPSVLFPTLDRKALIELDVVLQLTHKGNSKLAFT